METNSFQSINEAEKNRAAEFLSEQLQSVYQQTDRLFLILLIIQYAAGVFVAYFVSPLTWNGTQSQVHPHVFYAVIVGGIVTALPTYLILFHTGERITRNTIAISQMLMSGLLVHLTGGRIETHFHIFGSLAFLACYRDWRVLIPATIITTLDHFLRGWLYPYSVYGTYNGSEWRWIEHAGWVIFTDIFLIFSCIKSVEEMRNIAARNAQLDQSEERYRTIIEQMTEGIFLLEPETMQIIECNEAFASLLGCRSVAEAKTLTAYDFDVISQMEMKTMTDFVREQKESISTTRRYLRRDGKWIYVNITGKFITYNGIAAYCVNAHDITERKQAEVELKRLALVAEKTQNAVIISNPKGEIEWTNEGFTRLTGYELDEVIGREPGHFLRGEKTRIETDQEIRKALAELQPYEGELYNYAKDGRGYWVSITINPIMSSKGELQGFIAIESDITERKKVEEEMHLLALVAQRTQNGVIVITPDVKIQWVNEGFTRMTGYEAEEVIGKSPMLLTGEETSQETLAQLFKAVELHEPFTGELHNCKKNGEDYWMSMSLVPFHNDEGELQGYISVETDITERKAMEAQLQTAYEGLETRINERTAELVKANQIMSIEVAERKRAEAEMNQAKQFLDTVINNVPSLIFVKDIEGNFVLVNQALADIFGKTPADLIGKTDADFSHNPAEARQFTLEDIETLRNLEERFIADEQHTDTKGNVHWFQTIKRSVEMKETGSRYLIGVATDLTERKLMESQLRHMQKMESIGQLAAGIAHEINTPTQYVGDNTRFIRDAFDDFRLILEKYDELLKMTESGEINANLIAQIREEIEDADFEYLLEEVPTAIRQSLDGVSRIANIVQSMKDFAHPGSREKQSVDLNRAIASTITVARNEWKYVADIETNFDNNLPLVPCYLGEFNQVVLNMVVNAAHAIGDVIDDGSQDKGKIVITTTKVNNDWAEIRIGDTGKGIPAEIQAKVFDPFFTTKEVGKGTGQGLAISHTVVVDKHHGQLNFETEPGHGTTFIIRLPLGKSPNAEQNENLNYD